MKIQPFHVGVALIGCGVLFFLLGDIFAKMGVLSLGTGGAIVIITKLFGK